MGYVMWLTSTSIIRSTGLTCQHVAVYATTKEVNVLSTNQAAKRLGISRQRVHKLIQDGQIKAERQTRVRWAIPEEEVTRYAQKK